MNALKSRQKETGRPSLPAGRIFGCGFRLRGTTDLQFQTLFANFAPGSAVGEVFRRELTRNTTTRLVPRQQDAQVVLHVVVDVREKDIVAYSAVGRPRQYELRQRLRFRVSDGGDREYIPLSEITLRRDIGASDNALARVDDEIQLFRDMQNDMVNQLLQYSDNLEKETEAKLGPEAWARLKAEKEEATARFNKELAEKLQKILDSVEADDKL